MTKKPLYLFIRVEKLVLSLYQDLTIPMYMMRVIIRLQKKHTMTILVHHYQRSISLEKTGNDSAL
jgi:hypothetical protein